MPLVCMLIYLRNKNEKRWDRLGNFDRSMTRSKLLDNNTMLFIFYFYSNDDLRDPEKRRQNRFSEQRYLQKNSYYRLTGEA